MRISPSELMMMPEPDPCSWPLPTLIFTTDGSTRFATASTESVAGAVCLRLITGEVVVRAPLAVSVPPPLTASNPAAPATPAAPPTTSAATSRPATTPGPGRLRRCVRSSGTSGSERKPKPPTCSDVGS